MKVRTVINVVAYVFAVAVFVELTSRLAYRILPIARYLNVDDDASWRRDWVRRHKQDGAGMLYKFDIYDPTKGWSARPNFHGVGPSGETLNTNSRGLRGLSEFSYVKNPKKTRVVLIGDSFLFGDEVSDDQTIASDLQQMLPAAEIINLGGHGYGQDQMLIRLREEGIKYRPDIVIIGFLGDDMTRNLLSFRDFAKPRFVLDERRLRLVNSPVPTPEHVLAEDWRRLRFLDLISASRFRIRSSLGLYQEEMESISGALLAEMAKVSDSVHAVPIIAYLPIPADAFSSKSPTPDERFMFAVCSRIAVAKCFSARPEFAAQMANAPPFKLGGHLDPRGQRAVASAIADYLTKAELIGSGNLFRKQHILSAEHGPR